MKKTVKNKFWICFALIAVVLVADQVMKIWIKTNFCIGESVDLIGDWCRLYFVENIGMAFGMAFGGSVGKLVLTLFRLVASVVIMWLLVRLIRRDQRYTLLISVALIFVGAVGNLIDSCFYGLIFSESDRDVVATLFPAGGGYGTLFHGRVVDMFYFPIAEWDWPAWMPFIGGNHFEFFNAIFNIADSAITIGVILLIIDQLFLQPKDVDETENTVADSAKNDENTPREITTEPEMK